MFAQHNQNNMHNWNFLVANACEHIQKQSIGKECHSTVFGGDFTVTCSSFTYNSETVPVCLRFWPPRLLFPSRLLDWRLLQGLEWVLLVQWGSLAACLVCVVRVADSYFGFSLSHLPPWTAGWSVCAPRSHFACIIIMAFYVALKLFSYGLWWSHLLLIRVFQ